MYMYVIEKIDVVANVGSLRELLRHIRRKKRKPDFPRFLFGDTGNIPYREEFAAAREVNRMVREMQEVKEKGRGGITKRIRSQGQTGTGGSGKGNRRNCTKKS